MSEEVFEVFKITYTIILPLLIGYIASSVKNNKKQRNQLTEAITNINNKMEGFDEKLDDVKCIISDDRMRTSRYRIIRYDDECRQGIAHSEDHETQILEDIDVYKTYCKEHPDFINHKGQNAMKRIINHEQNETYIKEAK